MTVGGNYDDIISSQDFRTSEAAKNKLTTTQLDALDKILGPLVHDLGIDLQKITADIKGILNNPHLTKDGMAVEARHMQQVLQDRLDKFMEAAKKAVKDAMTKLDPGVEGKIDSFLADLSDEVKGKTGVSELLQKLQQKGQTSIFDLASTGTSGLGATQTIFPPLPSPNYQPPPSDPTTHPAIDPPMIPQYPNYTPGDLDSYLQYLLDSSKHTWSIGAQQLIRAIRSDTNNSIKSQLANNPGKIFDIAGLIPALQQLVQGGDQDVYMRYPGLTEEELQAICKVVTQGNTSLTFTPATDIDKKLGDLGIMISNSVPGSKNREILEYFSNYIADHLKSNSTLQDLQSIARDFSQLDAYKLMDANTMNQLATFAGISPSPLMNFLEKMRAETKDQGTQRLFDALEETAKAQGLDKKTNFNIPGDFTNFMNTALKSMHGGVDMYLYGNVTPDTLQFVNQKYFNSTLTLPPQTEMDTIIKKYMAFKPTDQSEINLKNKIIGLLQQITTGSSAATGATDVAKLHAMLSDLYFNHDPTFMGASVREQSELFQLADYSFKQMYTDKFSGFLSQNPNMSRLVSDFIGSIGAIGPDDFHNKLANFLTNAEGDKMDVFMRYPNVKVEDLQKLNQLFNTQFPIPQPSSIDTMYQNVMQRLNAATPGSGDYNVLYLTMFQIQSAGSQGNPADLHTWAQDFLKTRISGFSNVSQATKDFLNSF